MEEKNTLLKNETENLPFIYERTYDQSKAEFSEYRKLGIVWEDEVEEAKTDEEILEKIKKEKIKQLWYTSPEWKDKGLPVEQLQMEIDNNVINFYNFNKEKPFTNQHIEIAERVFGKMSSSFPEVLNKIKYVLIDDKQIPSLYADPEKYPLSGYAYRNWDAFHLYPRGMDLIPFRIPSVTNFEGVMTHELTHLISKNIEQEWKNFFKWELTSGHPDEWEMRTTSNGIDNGIFNKSTGEMAPKYQYPLQPEQCVTFYAKLDWDEDVCESMVAYLYEPQLLKSLSPKKFEILSNFDQHKEMPKIKTIRLPKSEIKLPVVEPQTVYYFIHEDKSFSSIFKPLNNRRTKK